MDTQEILKNLNKEQQQAVLSTDGVVLVIAGAGSGKTRTLISRISYLIAQKNVKPENILAITFTNKATREMKERLMHLETGNNVWVSTFHAMCVRILKDYIYLIDGYTKYFSIYDESDKKKVIKQIINDLDVFKADGLVDDVNYHLSNIKNQGLTIDEWRKNYSYYKNLDDIEKIITTYEDRMRKNNALDFDDLLVKTYELLSSYETVRHYYQNLFKYIHIDEFQDTNVIQYKIVKILSGLHKNLFVVGDEDQSIYGWRGASVENIGNINKDYQNVKLIKLEQNYRSTKNILALANKLIVNNKRRIEKALWTNNDEGDNVKFYKAFSETDEADFVVKNVYNLINHGGVEPNEIAILFRLNALSRLVEEKLLNYNLPYLFFGGQKFYERAEIKNVLAYLQLLYNPNDNENIKRIINFPKRGIGKTTEQNLEQLSYEHGVSIFDIIMNIEKHGLTSGVKQKLSAFKDVLKQVYALKEEGKKPTQVLTDILEITKIYESYDKENEEDYNRILNIGQLEQSLKNFEYNNEECEMIDFLQSITLQSEQEQLEDESDNKNKVRISTIHASKGLEFKAVFVIGAEEKLFPLNRAMDDELELEEERRLMYVAVTRAKKYLFLSACESRFLYGGRSAMQVSRFIKEMELVKTYDNNETYRQNKQNFYNSQRQYNDYGNAYLNNNERDSQQNSQNYTQVVHNYATTTEKPATNLDGIMTQKLQKQQKSYADFVEGVQVLHPKFGIGEIIKSSVSTGGSSVSVRFSGIGVKELSLEFAPLQIIAGKK